MANESDPAREDDILDDLNLDDVDLDALLEEDVEPAASAPASGADGGARKTAKGGPDALDDAEEITFTDDEAEADVESLLADDLHGTDGSGADDRGGGTGGTGDGTDTDEIDELTVADLLDGDDLFAEHKPKDASTGAEDVAGGDRAGDAGDDDDLDLDALLSDDGDEEEAPPPIPRESAAEDDAAAAAAILGDDFLEDDLDDGTDVLGALDDDPLAATTSSGETASSGETETDVDALERGDASGPKAPGGKGKGKGKGKKGKFGKTRAPGKREKAPKKGKKPGRAGKLPKKEKPVPAVVRAKGSIRFVCSECYEEFLLSSSFASETVTCPECLHVGKRPDDDFLRTVNIHKSGERKSFAAVTLVGLLLLVALVSLLWMHSPYCDLELVSDEATRSNMSLALMGGGAVLGILFFWLLSRFESNRWEVYF